MSALSHPDREPSVVRSSTDLWLSVRSVLKQSLGADAYENWVRSLHFEAFDGSTVILSAPTPFLRRRAQTLYGDALLACFRTFEPAIAAVRIRLRSIEAIGLPIVETAVPEAPVASVAAPAPTAIPIPLPVMPPLPFIVGPGNRLAASAVASVVAGRDQAVLVHGWSGTGKTHLLRTTAADLGASGLFLSGRAFVAASKDDPRALQEQLGAVSILLLDGLDNVTSVFAQQRLVEFLDRPGRRLIASASRPAADLDISTWLASRLGLSFAMADPDMATRRRIFAEALARETVALPGFTIAEAVGVSIVSDIVNARSLLAAVRRLATSFAIDGRPASEVVAHTLLADLKVAHRATVRIEDILAAVCEICGVGKPELLSQRRSWSIVRPRHVAMYLARKWTTRSLPEIGRRFGGRDHTTVLHACVSVDAKRPTDPDMDGWINAVETKLQLRIAS